jgi:hypothetical protein
MVITLGPELEAALNGAANRRGMLPEVLAISALEERFVNPVAPPEPRDEWEKRLFELAEDCGASLSNEALRRESLYD